jgi:hypothetical protein
MKIFNIVILLCALIITPAVLLAAQSDNQNSGIIPIPSETEVPVTTGAPAPNTLPAELPTTVLPAILNSSTYLSTYGLNMNNVDNKYMPFYENLNFKYPSLGNNLSIDASGWLRYDLLTSKYTQRTNADFAYGYINYQPGSLPVRLRLGRVYSWFGAANDRYDGVEMLVNNLSGFGLGAFVGSEVDSELHDTPGGITTGGRLSYDSSLFGVGGSLFYAANSGYVSQYRWGMDGWVRPVDMLYLSGRYYYDTVDKRLYDGTIKASLTPWKRVFLNAQYALFNPASLIDKTSIFWVFNTESYRTLVMDIGYRVLDDLSVSLDATRYMYSSDGNAYTYGGRANYDMHPYSIGLELSKTDASPTDYLTTRLYIARNFAMGFYANIDAIFTSYLGEINGYSQSVTGHAAVGKTIINNLKLTLSADSIDGPFIRHGGFGMLSLKYEL